jgi:predicted dehydrogenase
LCDKPLATTAADARDIYRRTKETGLKTAYAASYRYQPQTLYAREMVAAGTLGRVFEAEFVSHYHWPSLMPFGWPHRLEEGGGRLNNNFTHKLAIAQNILDGDVLAAMGECRNDLKRVPIAGKVHDFREYFTQALTPDEAAKCDWGDVTSDWAYTVLVRIGRGTQPLEEAVTATFRHSGLRFGRNTDYVAVYGEKGTLHIEQAYTQGPMFLSTDGKDWEELTIPQRVFDSLPDDADPTQRNWTQLARDLVADIRGEEQRNYLTFRDGWIYQEVIDLVRSGSNWTEIQNDLTS